MIEWSENDLMIRDAVREFIDKEIRPNIDALESGEMLPYPIVRKLFSQFGLDVMAAEAVKNMLDRLRARERDGGSIGAEQLVGPRAGSASRRRWRRSCSAELAGVSLGTVAAVGVSLGLGAATIMAARHAGTEGALAAAAGDDGKGCGVGDHGAGFRLGCVRRDEDLRPSATVTTTSSTGRRRSSPTVPTPTRVIVFAKLDDDSVADKRDRPVLTFVLDSGMPGFTQGKPFKKMGMHASPTGELFFDNVRLGCDRLLGATDSHTGGDGRDSARAGFAGERMAVALLSLGIINECHRLCIEYAKNPHAVGPEHRQLPADPAQAREDGDRADQRAEHGVFDAGGTAGSASCRRWRRRRR